VSAVPVELQISLEFIKQSQKLAEVVTSRLEGCEEILKSKHFTTFIDTLNVWNDVNKEEQD
jgi:hypothetical protein